MSFDFKRLLQAIVPIAIADRVKQAVKDALEGSRTKRSVRRFKKT
jgi:hypothetical protein